ncbi:hypothetical protein TNCT_534591 [Trichonephila clavata]|uniref:Uncharacterized protein n=1 Tax=Trichonephila clavata TaxID=2740835 RepID=A0A8X6L8A7_TRICU|nr:hypothetical protein TNCT_534591 [Trichonephila clavata]
MYSTTSECFQRSVTELRLNFPRNERSAPSKKPFVVTGADTKRRFADLLFGLKWLPLSRLCRIADSCPSFEDAWARLATYFVHLDIGQTMGRCSDFHSTPQRGLDQV